jgi:N-acyl-D-amino-acid deacylase
VVAIAGLASSFAGAQSPETARVRNALTRGYAAIQTAQLQSRKTQPCAATCHLQIYGAFSYRAIRERGIALDEELARTDLTRAFRAQVTNLDEAVADNALGEVGINSAFWLVAAHEIGLPRTIANAALARAVALQQHADGSWPAFHTRPPSSHSAFTFTALGLRAIQLYGHANLISDTEARVARARTWLQSRKAPETEDRTYQLLGLWWAGADRSVLAPLARTLAAAQRADGGWNSLTGRASDAYSTGEALVALHDAGGMATDDPVWRRGVEFLLRSQQPDGTWHVVTRLPSWVNPPYFESGYPYKRDQFISAAGANWSLRALSRLLPPSAAVPERLPLADARPRDLEPWVETALFGSTDDLRRLLDGGLSPNAATASGRTSLLMLAVPDVDKVALLEQRGADVNALSGRRYTALLVAAQFNGATDAMRTLMARGAQVRVPGDRGKPAADASTLFFAAHAGNAAILSTLQKGGDGVDSPTRMFGTVPVAPLELASAWGYTPVMRTLLDLGAKVGGPAGMNAPLIAAVQGHQLDSARLLIERGANVNLVDDEGRTPLMHAAVADFGDTRMVELLLKAGARKDTRDAGGLAAADYARQFNHEKTLALVR